jgi:SAM-dependent MidA family methyltransferase
VDFTALGDAALAAGFRVSGFTTQAQFLLCCGIGERLVKAQTDGGPDAIRAATAVKRLLLPTEMGERFKVMALTIGSFEPLVGFKEGDIRHRL